MTLTVYERENGHKHYPLILKGMNGRFRNEEQFELRLDTICLEIAQELNGKYDRQGDEIFFDFTGLDIKCQITSLATGSNNHEQHIKQHITAHGLLFDAKGNRNT